MRGAVLGAACVALTLAACNSNDDRSFLGYAEGEYIRVAAPLAGQLAALEVTRGQPVAADAPLFQLESTSEQAQLQAAEARAAAARARLADLSKGARPAELAVVAAQLAEARTEQQLAETQLKRAQELRRRAVVSGEDLDEAQAKRDRAGARVKELQARIESAELAARGDAQRAAAEDVKAAQAAVVQARWQLAQKAPRAPRAALVEDTYYQPGEFVPAGSPVVSLLPPENRLARFFVPEATIGTLRPGASVRVSCDGCGAAFDAVVSFVAAQPEFAPPVIYSRGQRERLVFLVEARPAPADATKLQPGQPLEIVLP